MSDKNPEAVISYGGDGTLMKAEYLYPGIPKLYLKNSRIAKLGHQTKENEAIVDHFVRGEYSIEEVMKLELQVKGEVLIGLNDIVIHNENPRYGIRYMMEIDGVPIRGEIIGDGVVFARHSARLAIIAQSPTAPLKWASVSHSIILPNSPITWCSKIIELFAYR